MLFVKHSSDSRLRLYTLEGALRSDSAIYAQRLRRCSALTYHANGVRVRLSGTLPRSLRRTCRPPPRPSSHPSTSPAARLRNESVASQAPCQQFTAQYPNLDPASWAKIMSSVELRYWETPRKPSGQRHRLHVEGSDPALGHHVGFEGSVLRCHVARAFVSFVLHLFTI